MISADGLVGVDEWNDDMMFGIGMKPIDWYIALSLRKAVNRVMICDARKRICLSTEDATIRAQSWVRLGSNGRCNDTSEASVDERVCSIRGEFIPGYC